MKGGCARVKANQALIAKSRICRVGPHRNSNPKIKHSTQKNEPCVGSSSRKTKHFVSSRSPFLPQTSIHSAVKYQFHPSIHPSMHPFIRPFIHSPFHSIHPFHPIAFPSIQSSIHVFTHHIHGSVASRLFFVAWFFLGFAQEKPGCCDVGAVEV